MLRLTKLRPLRRGWLTSSGKLPIYSSMGSSGNLRETTGYSGAMVMLAVDAIVGGCPPIEVEGQITQLCRLMGCSEGIDDYAHEVVMIAHELLAKMNMAQA